MAKFRENQEKVFLDWVSSRGISGYRINGISANLSRLESFGKDSHIINCSIYTVNDTQLLWDIHQAASQAPQMRQRPWYLQSLLQDCELYIEYLNSKKSVGAVSKNNFKTEPQNNPETSLKVEVKTIKEPEIVPAQQRPIYTSNFYKIKDILCIEPLYFTYVGKKYEASNWKQLYIQLVRLFWQDYRLVLKSFLNKRITGRGGIDFASDNQANSMLEPQRIDNNLWVETKLSPADILNRIIYLLDNCPIDSGNLQVSYTKIGEKFAPTANLNEQSYSKLEQPQNNLETVSNTHTAEPQTEETASINDPELKQTDFALDLDPDKMEPVTLFYFDEEYQVKGWKELYAQVLSCLLEDYPRSLPSYLGQSVLQDGVINFAEAEGSRLMVEPKRIGSNFYAEMELDPISIYFVIISLLSLCNVDHCELKIVYTAVEDRSEEQAEKNIAEQPSAETFHHLAAEATEPVYTESTEESSQEEEITEEITQADRVQAESESAKIEEKPTEISSADSAAKVSVAQVQVANKTAFNKVTAVYNPMEVLIERVSKLENENLSLESKYLTLEAKYSDLEVKYSALESRCFSFESELQKSLAILNRLNDSLVAVSSVEASARAAENKVEPALPKVVQNLEEEKEPTVNKFISKPAEPKIAAHISEVKAAELEVSGAFKDTEQAEPQEGVEEAALEAVDNTAEVLEVDFNRGYDKSYCHTLIGTRPVNLFYFGTTYKASNWHNLYIQAIKCLIKSYRHIVDKYINNSFPHSNLIDLASEYNKVNNMRNPKEILPGIYLELGHFGAYGIVKRLKDLLDLCDVDYKNVKISYYHKRSDLPAVTVEAVDTTAEVLEVDFSKGYDFSYESELRYTKPIEISYFNRKFQAPNWCKLYIQIVKYLFEDYRHIVSQCINKKLTGSRRIDFADSKYGMRWPEEILPGLYLEVGNFGPYDVVKRLKCLFDLCGVDYENVKIFYRRKRPKLLAEQSAAAVQASAAQVDNSIKILEVDFNKGYDLSYKPLLWHTRPISFSYFEDKYEFDSWRKLYIQAIKCFVQDYFHILKDYANKKLPYLNRIDFVSEDQQYRLKVPVAVGSGLYVEVDHCRAFTVVKRLRSLLDLCNVDYDNVKISYRLPLESDSEQPVQPVEAELTAPAETAKLESQQKQVEPLEVKAAYAMPKFLTEDMMADDSKLLKAQFTQPTGSSFVSWSNSDKYVDEIEKVIEDLGQRNDYKISSGAAELNSKSKPVEPVEIKVVDAVAAVPEYSPKRTEPIKVTIPNESLYKPRVVVDKDALFKKKILDKVSEAELDGITSRKLAEIVSLPEYRVSDILSNLWEIVELNGKFYHEEAFSDYEEAANELEKIIEDLMQRNDQYIPIERLYDCARGRMSMFLNDNGIDDPKMVYDLAKHLFEEHCYHGKHYNFFDGAHIASIESKINSVLDLISRYFRQHKGVLSEDDLENYFKQLGLSSSPKTFMKLNEEHSPFLYCDYDQKTLMSVEAMSIDAYWLNRVAYALDKLFADLGNHVILRNIDYSWYDLLPELPKRNRWNAMLLQSVLGSYSTELRGARTVGAYIKYSRKNNLHSMVVSGSSSIQTFADVVAAWFVDTNQSSNRFDAEELRIKLERDKIIGENELSNRMCQVLDRDPRFVWNADSSVVNIIIK
ncbi:MAG: hypothetical protein ACI376_04560 [Candidatus Bruticola sp.]